MHDQHTLKPFFIHNMMSDHYNTGPIAQIKNKNKQFPNAKFLHSKDNYSTQTFKVCRSLQVDKITTL